MSWSKKIDKRKYTVGTLVNLGFAVFFAYPNWNSVLWLTFMVAASICNHYATIMVFTRLVESRMMMGNDTEINRKKMVFHLFLKAASLIVAFICLVKFARNMVLQGLAIYIFQLIILCLSIKNIGSFFKKGFE
jgi:hypothetical protein